MTVLFKNLHHTAVYMQYDKSLAKWSMFNRPQRKMRADRMPNLEV